MGVKLHKDYDLSCIQFKKFAEGKGKHKTVNFNNIICFDIETSNGYRQDNGTVIPFSHKVWNDEYEKWLKSTREHKFNGPTSYKNPVSIMYVWQCAIESGKDVHVYMGRTWGEFLDFIEELEDIITDIICLGSIQITNQNDDSKNWMLQAGCVSRPTLHFYVHNLGFEMQFLRNVFKIEKVFARTSRKPMKFEVKTKYLKLLFHDTLCLTQKSLEDWAKDAKLKTKKLKGNLDYLKIRNSQTSLTQQEINYCINDVVLMVEGLQKYRKKYDNKLTNIPTTQTGEVRLVCQEKIAQVNHKWAESCYMIDKSYSFDFFNRLVTAFAGGWTHANQRYSGNLQGQRAQGKNIICYDFASSYPSVMTTSKFPISKFREIDETRLNYLETLNLDDSNYRFLVMLRFTNIRSTVWNTYFSSSKCVELSDDAILDNGKVVAATSMTVFITDYDYDTIKKSYSFDNVEVLEAYEADADYLPIEFIKVILDYFRQKTALKGTGNESAYVAAKQFINAIYGCCVLRILTDEITFDENGWGKIKVEDLDFDKLMSIPEDFRKMERQIEKQFTTYQIGVWIPAVARHRLFDAVLHLDSKVVYCDTDSIKGYFDDNDIAWFDDYNAYISSLQEKVAAHYNFPVDLYSPLSSKNQKKQLGIFEREHDCIDFKALRAKVYACKFWDDDENDYVIETTIAGLPKRSGIKLIKDVDDLSDNLFWTPEMSEKLCSHYLENQGETIWTDEFGNTEKHDEKYGIMLEPTGFDLSIADEYQQLLDIVTHYEDCDYFNTPEIIRDYWNKTLAK